MSQDEIYNYVKVCVSPVTAKNVSIFLNKDVTRVERGLRQLTKFKYLSCEIILLNQNPNNKRKTLIKTYTLYKKEEKLQ